MSEYLSDLCILFVDDLYGELTGKVFKALCARGRTTIPVLKNLTQLSVRQVKHGLSVLVQQQLASWYTPPDEATQYEPNFLEAYNLVRIGKYTQAAEDRFSTLASELVSSLLLLGHATLGELVEAHRSGNISKTSVQVPSKAGLLSKTPSEPFENSLHKDGSNSVPLHEVLRTLNDLVRFGLFSLVHDSHFRSKADNDAELEMVIPPIEEYKGKNKGERASLRDLKMREKQFEWKYGNPSERSGLDILHRGVKRPLGYPNGDRSRKKSRLDDMTMNDRDGLDSDEEEASISELSVKDDLVFRVNHEKFAVMLRNELLVNAVEQRIGKSTSKVYKHVLRMLEHKTKAVRDDIGINEHGDHAAFFGTSPISTATVKAAFPDLSEFSDSLGKDDDQDEVDPSRFDSPKNPIRQHLLLLSTHPEQFLDHHPPIEKAPERWAVDYPRLTQNFKIQRLFQTITSRFGTSSSRVARVCHEKGRLDGKTLCELSLLPLKVLRASAAPLQKAGLLEQQEVPRDSARVASRTSFLYYFDDRKCKSRILEDCYKTMVRCLQRLSVERAKVAGVLEKAERSDVKGRESDFLGEREKETLAKWRDVEERIWAEVGKVDEMVSILRDF